ncbi:peroxisomal adenine nucleotide transporter 1 [Kluyveromyces marxianus]|nr:peroxisomal adenine nucleotide transporter 1 [Kluyveromyces marxianus]
MASLENAFVGAVSSGLANLAVYPLDLAKTVIQTQLKQGNLASETPEGRVTDGYGSDSESQAKETKKKGVREIQPRPESPKDVRLKSLEERYRNTLDVIVKVYKTEGVQGLYRGLGASLLGSFIQSFSYFFWYTIVRRQYFKIKKVKGQAAKFSTAEELLLSMVAAATSQVFTNPVNTVSTKQQTRRGLGEDNSFLAVAKDVFEENGITGFWKGLKVSLVLTINPSITYASAEKLKDLIYNVEWNSKELNDSSLQLKPSQNFLIGVLSKIISTFLTHPLIVAKASLQRNASQFTSFQDVLAYLYRHEGFLSLWKGILPQLLKGVIVQGLLFMFKGELAKNIKKLLFVLQVYRKRRLAKTY